MLLLYSVPRDYKPSSHAPLVYYSLLPLVDGDLVKRRIDCQGLPPRDDLCAPKMFPIHSFWKVHLPRRGVLNGDRGDEVARSEHVLVVDVAAAGIVGKLVRERSHRRDPKLMVQLKKVLKSNAYSFHCALFPISRALH